MRRALEAARRGWGDTHPNPMVGALIVENGRVVADGYHARAGEPHAEIMALKNLGRPPAPGAALYVTLEPCSTTGQTPPYTEAIICAGIKNVVVGATDPNPKHAGRGLTLLRKAGIEVEEGVLADECTDLNFIFNHWITNDTPLIAGKIATTLDGRVATRSGESKWITGPAARCDVMRWRRLFPIVAVGAGTVLADDPQLTSRLGKTVWCPQRFVFDRTLRTVTDPLPRVYSDEFCKDTAVFTGARPDPQKEAQLARREVDVLSAYTDDDDWVYGLREFCENAGVPAVLIEGGPTLLSAFLQLGQLDYLFAYRAPKFVADDGAISAFRGRFCDRLKDAYTLADVRHATLGDDQLMRGRVVYPARGGE